MLLYYNYSSAGYNMARFIIKTTKFKDEIKDHLKSITLELKNRFV
jgi:hypothetical protein